jgi:hypothetical protein
VFHLIAFPYFTGFVYFFLTKFKALYQFAKQCSAIHRRQNKSNDLIPTLCLLPSALLLPQKHKKRQITLPLSLIDLIDWQLPKRPERLK